MRRHQCRVQYAGHVLLADEAHWTDDVEHETNTERPDDQQVADPAHAASDQRHDQADDPPPQQDDRGEHVEPQLGPSVGLLVEAQSQCRRDEHRAGEERQADGGSHERLAALALQTLGGNDQTAGQDRHGHELQESTSRIVGVRHARRLERVQPTEQIGALERDEQEEYGVHGKQHGDDFGRADPPAAGVGAGYHCWGRGCRKCQPAGGQPGKHGGECDAPAGVAEVELNAEQIVHEAGEDRIGRGEERDEDQHDRDGDRQATEDRERGSGTTADARRRRKLVACIGDGGDGAGRRPAESAQGELDHATE